MADAKQNDTGAGSRPVRVLDSDPALSRQFKMGPPTGALRRSSGVVSLPNNVDKKATIDLARTASATQSPFMARQAERAHMTGLSPIEEMKLAQNELRAKAATHIVRLRYNVMWG